MSTVTSQADFLPIYGEVVEELGDIPADTRVTAERVLREAEEAVAYAGRRQQYEGLGI